MLSSPSPVNVVGPASLGAGRVVVQADGPSRTLEVTRPAPDDLVVITGQSKGFGRLATGGGSRVRTDLPVTAGSLRPLQPKPTAADSSHGGDQGHRHRGREHSPRGPQPTHESDDHDGAQGERHRLDE